MPATPRVTRRSTEQVRALVVAAAERQFAEHGYAQTTMRGIAGEAGISLSVLYRQFPSKEGLFSATLLAPFLETFREFAATWSEQVDSPWEDERLVREFVRDLYRNLLGHRHSLIALLAAGEDSSTQLLAEVRAGLAAGLQDLQAMAVHEAKQRGWFSPDTVRYSNAFVITMTTGLVLIGPWLGDPIRDGDDAMIDAATRMAMYGMRLQPPG